jgi:integrase/recombinase XerD
MWEIYKKGFKSYLQLERSLSGNSVDAYVGDLDKLTSYLEAAEVNKSPEQIELKDLQGFIKWVAELGLNQTSQARIISGIRAFYKYCLLEDITKKDPTLLLEAPKLRRRLPDVLSIEEINSILNEIDLSTPEGTRSSFALTQPLSVSVTSVT